MSSASRMQTYLPVDWETPRLRVTPLPALACVSTFRGWSGCSATMFWAMARELSVDPSSMMNTSKFAYVWFKMLGMVS